MMTQALKDEKFWDRVSRKYAASDIEDMAGYERSLARTVTYLHAKDRVLEVGCGTGTTALRLAPHAGDIIATDFSAKMLAVARDKAKAARVENVRFEKAAAGDARFEGQGFDVILAFNILHLVPGLDGVLASLHSSLKPGGLLISKTPCLKEMNPLIRWVMLPAMRAVGRAPYVNSLSASELEGAISSAGFGIVENAFHGSKGKDVRPYVVAKRV